jgi:hypothetical protein
MCNKWDVNEELDRTERLSGARPARKTLFGAGRFQYAKKMGQKEQF